MKAAVVHSIIEALAGSEKVALSIARLLSSMGFDVELIIVSGSKDLLQPKPPPFRLREGQNSYG